MDLVIKPDYSLDETAAKISRALGIVLSVETTGRYEEFPAFTAHKAGLDYILLGPPEPERDVRDEPTNDYCLSVVPSNDASEPTAVAELMSTLRSVGLRLKSAR